VGLRHLVPVAVVAVSLAGCGSGASTKTASTTTVQRHAAAAPPAKKHTGKAKSNAGAAAAGASATQPPHGPVLLWIKRLQHDLTTLHFYSGPITGRESGLTRTAIIRFQRTAHLKPDGLWGPKSQTALDRMLHRTPSKPPPQLGWIRNLQRDLTKLHFYTGSITGVETPATKLAVIRFQRAAHLKPDGLWGPKSQVALDKMLHRR
jgi:peptidoglycan hydrolase-like protein with peptidoglycan-binding domain